MASVPSILVAVLAPRDLCFRVPGPVVPPGSAMAQEAYRVCMCAPRHTVPGRWGRPGGGDPRGAGSRVSLGVPETWSPVGAANPAAGVGT